MSIIKKKERCGILFVVNCRMLRNASKLPGPEEVTATRNTIANALKDYALTKDCRWNFFLKHFNEVGGLTNRLCYNCDNCKIR